VATTTYAVPVDISGHIGGQPFSFSAGTVTPKDDDEAAALAYLELNGHLAAPVPEQPAEQPTRRTGKPKE
jgi:hypothetical protein